jgi:arabinofuranosyltransferase
MKGSAASRWLEPANALLLVVAWIGLYVGWEAFLFLCDDAYIAFRYVSNSVAGHGYLWNPPPFKPVDGYTSWLWVVLLDFVWRTTGAEPPVAANWISLLLSGLSLVLVALMVQKLRWPDALRPWRHVFVFLVLLGVVSNRTFLAWTSSGLETALFNLSLLWWVYVGAWGDRERKGWPLLFAAAALLMTLTRPDGLPFAAATAVILLADWLGSKKRRRTGSLSALGLLCAALLAFFLWKLMRYGSWLPNTYHAKVYGLWPQAGLRYLASFVLEYALWLWPIPLLWVGIGRLRRRISVDLRVAVMVCAILFHVAYYAIVVGGDHFEYRVYSHLIPLFFVSFAWALTRVGWSVKRGALALAAFVAASWPIPWIHWVHTRDMWERDATFRLSYRVAPHLPVGLRWYGQAFDSLQAYVIYRFVGMRHQEHKAFHRFKRALYPPRAVGAKIPYEGYPVHVAGEVGLVGWLLPNVAIIDGFGLNDYFVARGPVAESSERRMGHDRAAPPGYCEAFRANVRLEDGQWVVDERAEPLDAEEVVRIQEKYTAWIEKQE